MDRIGERLECNGECDGCNGCDRDLRLHSEEHLNEACDLIFKVLGLDKK